MHNIRQTKQCNEKYRQQHSRKRKRKFQIFSNIDEKWNWKFAEIFVLCEKTVRNTWR